MKSWMKRWVLAGALAGAAALAGCSDRESGARSNRAVLPGSEQGRQMAGASGGTQTGQASGHFMSGSGQPRELSGAGAQGMSESVQDQTGLGQGGSGFGDSAQGQGTGATEGGVQLVPQSAPQNSQGPGGMTRDRDSTSGGEATLFPREDGITSPGRSSVGGPDEGGLPRRNWLGAFRDSGGNTGHGGEFQTGLGRRALEQAGKAQGGLGSRSPGMNGYVGGRATASGPLGAEGGEAERHGTFPAFDAALKASSGTSGAAGLGNTRYGSKSEYAVGQPADEHIGGQFHHAPHQQKQPPGKHVPHES